METSENLGKVTPKKISNGKDSSKTEIGLTTTKTIDKTITKNDSFMNQLATFGDGSITEESFAKAKLCLQCESTASIGDDLLGKSEKGFPENNPDCDNKWYENVGFRIKWNNDHKNLTTDGSYVKDSNDASVYSQFEVLNEFISFSKETIGTATTLPIVAGTQGITNLDDVVEEFKTKANNLLFGKSNIDRILADIEWSFNTKERTTINISHTQFWSAYVKELGGTYDFNVKFYLDNEEITELSLPKKEEKLSLINEKGLNVDQKNKKIISTLNKTRPRNNSESKSTQFLLAGKHNVRLAYTMNSGYAGLASIGLVNKIEKAYKESLEALKALSDVLSKGALFIAGKASAQDAMNSITDAGKQAIEAAVSILSVLLGALFDLFKIIRVYVKLFESSVNINCLQLNSDN